MWNLLRNLKNHNSKNANGDISPKEWKEYFKDLLQEQKTQNCNINDQNISFDVHMHESKSI